MAGVPFDAIDKIATPEIARAARKLVDAETELSRVKAEIEQLLASHRRDLSKKQLRSWRRAVQTGVMPPAIDAPSSAFALCWHCAAKVSTAEAVLTDLLASGLATARKSLLAATRIYLPPYLVFAAAGVCERISNQTASISLSHRNKRARAEERHLVLYLQRIAAKNDSLSEFGPGSWGTVDPGTEGVRFDPQPGIARREIFLERWTAHGVAAAINADPETRAEIAPRLHPAGRLEQDHFVLTETGQTIPLDPETMALLERCDGTHPAHSLRAELEKLRTLAGQKLIQWEMEVPALDAHAFDHLLEDISKWRDQPVRARWLHRLQPIVALSKQFGRTFDPGSRLAITEEARERMENLGAHKAATRFLYSATNPIGEECFRESEFTISENLINEVATEGAPWIDLWRDNYAFVAGRVAAGLRSLFEQASLQNGALPLPEFLCRCAEAKMPLAGAGMVALAHLAFREVKEAFRVILHDRASIPEYELTLEDCHFVRRQFSYEKFDQYTYPSADIQLAAASIEAVARGDYQWILAELHPPIALLHHGFYWSCPDKAALAGALERTLCGKPLLYYGYFAADFTATTAVRLDALPNSTKFVAAQRSAGEWQTFHPADTEVFIDESGDVGVRTRSTHEYLGSFARGWVIPLGFHPFSFSLGKHTPRLRCGKVIVQRESWTVTLDELGTADFTGVSRDLVVAVERLRAARHLPRYVYIRPTEQALRRSGVEGRDKDTKPVFIDLESYLFLEIFHRWLTKAGELEVTEMLPTPEQLLWQEADGRRTFELRTQIVPS